MAERAAAISAVPSIATRYLLCTRPEGQERPQRVLVIGHGGDGDGVVTIVFERRQVAPAFASAPIAARRRAKVGHVQRRVPMAIARLQRRRSRQLLNRRTSYRCAAACRPV